MSSLIRPSFEVVKEMRISQLRIKTVFEDIIIWQTQNDDHSWTTNYHPNMMKWSPVSNLKGVAQL
jgi:hypothetical protein